MRYILYFMVYACLVIGLFITFLYLMTIVDPDLVQLPEKAARMIKTDVERGRGREELPQEMVVEISKLWNRSSIILIN